MRFTGRNRLGGLEGPDRRANDNFNALERFVEATPWLDFLAEDPATRSNTSVCLKIH